jgi:hypothetical protein
LEQPFPGEEALDDVAVPDRTRAAAPLMWGRVPMVLWPAVSLIGFLVLTALVIAMGTRSTARYEREREAARPAPARAAAEPVGAASI